MSGVYSAIPSVGCLIVIPVSGWLADFLRARYLSTVVVRKVFTFTGQIQRLFACLLLFVCLLVCHVRLYYTLQLSVVEL